MHVFACSKCAGCSTCTHDDYALILQVSNMDMDEVLARIVGPEGTHVRYVCDVILPTIFFSYYSDLV